MKKHMRGKLLASIVAALPALAWAVPSVKIGTAAFIDPTAANGYYSATTGATDSVVTPGRPNEIVELARALGNDVDLIYDFVRNNIDTVWMYGLQKGALGTMIDRSGTSFDQAHLMVELLRQAGYTAEYKVGTITLDAAQFSAWTGITNATAACQLLASGGIPGAINGSTAASCNYGSASVSSVQLGHIWVSVTLPGGSVSLFDPSYKPYQLKPAIDLAGQAQMTSGEALAQAASGMQTGGSSAAFVRNLNSSALNSRLQTYGTNLLNYIRANAPAGEIEDIVGGGTIQRYVGDPVQPYAAAAQRTWSGDIPDAYRTSLRVQVTKSNGLGAFPTIFDKLLYVDEIYGRKLILTTDFGRNTWLKVVDEFGQEAILGTHTDQQNAGHMAGDITLTASHPYAAAANGSTALTGDYMDVTVVKPAQYTVPLTIVHGWGDTGKGLVEKWGSRVDQHLPNLPSNGGCETCGSGYFASKGDGRREQLAASWLAQSSRAAKLHASIANSIYSLHHSIGIVAANTTFRSIVLAQPDGPSVYAYTVVDSFDRIDVDSAFSLTSKTADALNRRAAIHAIAATSEALEGSVSAQISDLPDTASTSTRFEWGNLPPVAEDPSASQTTSIGPRRFYDFNSGNHLNASGVTLVEGSPVAVGANFHNRNFPTIGTNEFNARRNALQRAITTYAEAGFNVVASEEAFLGPGQRAGAFDQEATTVYRHEYTDQRGGALVATKYANGEPVEIAHVVVGPKENSKGGGGGAQTVHQAQYDPSQAADILKARFVDRSKAMGVDLQSGALTYVSPASLTVGSGEFPYSLTANIIWTGAAAKPELFGPTSHVEPQGPWTTNWNNTLTVSGSGLEAMGDGDVRATAGTIAAFMAAQDIYKAAVSTQREVAAVLVNAWWVRQLSGNVVTANVGTDTRQFVKLVDGTWTMTGPGPFATLTQNGLRTIHAKSCTGVPYVLTRGWNYAGMSYVVRNAHGDEQTYSYWETTFRDPSSEYCADQHGFRLSQWTFPYGVTVNLDYEEPIPGESLPELIRVRNSLGRKIEFVESGRGGFHNGLMGTDYREVDVTQPYPTDGDATHTDPSRAVTRFEVDKVGNRHVLKRVIAADSLPSVQYVYDTLWRVKEAHDAVALQHGGRNPYEFFLADGARGERLDPAGGRYTVFYDDRKRPLGYLDELGRLTSVQHDGRGRVTRYIYPELDEEEIRYDDRNNPWMLRNIPKPGSDLQPVTIEASWNEVWNKPDWINDGRSNLTSFEYYGNGQLYAAIRPAAKPGEPRGMYLFEYNSIGQLEYTTDPTQLVFRNIYDTGTGNLLTTQHVVLDDVTVYQHDTIGNVTWIMDPRGNTTEFKYDNNRRKTHTQRHNGAIDAPVIAAEWTEYDDFGRVRDTYVGTAFSGTNVTAWQRQEHRTYTPTGKIETSENAAGNVTTYPLYDPMDRLEIVQDPVGRRTRFVYDLAGQLRREIRAEGAALQFDYATYTYTDNGQRRTVKDANNNLSTFEYDGFDRLKRWRFPISTSGANVSCVPQNQVLGCYEEYGYDENDNRTSVRKRDGQIITYQYDTLNREILKDVPGTDNDVYSEYDLAGRPMWKRFGSTTGLGIDYAYNDPAKRLSSETSFGRTIGFQYDIGSNRIRVTYPDDEFATYKYDALNRVTDVYENGVESAAALLAHYDYDVLSRRDFLSRGNGPTTDYGYDVASRLLRLAQDLPGTSYDTTLNFTYTPASQLESRATNNDALGWWSDIAQSRSYARNGLNQYTSVNAATYGYDHNGNLTSDGSRTFVYDVENRLTSVTAAPAPDTKSMTLTYDPLGRLRETISGGSTTQFLYEGDRLLAEYNGNDLVRRYVHGAGVDEPIVWYEGPDLTDRRWLHTDERGSVIAHTKPAGTVDGYSYGPYGERAAWAGSRFSYTGQIMLPEVRLYHYKARVYDPELGRFLQTDPIGYDDDVNLYAYVKNDPLNRVDPRGKNGLAIGVGIGVLVIAGACEASGGCDSVRDSAEQLVGAVIQGIEYGAVPPGVVLAEEERKTAEAHPDGTVTDAQGKPIKGSSGGPGAGKRFPAESPATKEAKEGVPCRYCGQPTTNEQGKQNSRQRDHIDPKSQGGNNSKANEADSCRTCNRDKSAKGLWEWVKEKFGPF